MREAEADRARVFNRRRCQLHLSSGLPRNEGTLRSKTDIELSCTMKPQGPAKCAEALRRFRVICLSSYKNLEVTKNQSDILCAIV